jgi:hypothetical protein
MAELASTIAEKILEKLGSLAYEEFPLVLDIKSELTELEGTMTTIQPVLLDAEEKQATNRLLSTWLRQLKDIFSDADDVLDEVEYEVLKKQVMRTYGRTSREVCGLFSCCSAFAFRFQLGHKIKDIREKLGKIAADKDQFNLIPRLEDRHVMHGRRDMSHMTHSLVPPSAVIGRNDDIEKLISLLRQPDANMHDNVIPIVGLGGLGKTTIAKLVFDDKRVANHFELRIWVCVSEDFDVLRILRKILESVTRENIDEKLGVDSVQTRLRKCLENKKFLLVLDDVWNEDRNKWIELKEFLSSGLEGSKIVLTTRSHRVASIVGTGPAYTLNCLPEPDCLSLFVKCAFKEGEDKQYPNLLEIGKEIVEKCKGVPLAIRILGSLLFSKVDEREWKFVRDNKIWKLEQKEGDILPALKLSYDQMPSHLKQCFALCSVFKKDHGFDSDELIAFWMAHGLLNKTPNKSQNLELEDVGDMYIKELFSRSFFQEATNHFWYYRFKMHDLVHDLALKVAEEECSSVKSYTQMVAGTVRHVSFFNNCREVPKCFYTISSGVRTILLMVQQVPALIEACISRFKYLRLLDISNLSFEVLPSSIGTLKHLRYLNLCRSPRLKKLPNSICNLYNLQTLLLHYCPRLERLPKDTRKMINLRHLTVTTTYSRLFENGVCSFNSLRVLRISNCSRLEVLFQGMDGWLTKLRTLVVEGCDSKHLTALEILVIQTCEELSLMGGEDDHDLKLSLRKLLIEDLPKLEVLPQWLQGSSSTLQFLRISKCRNLTALPEWLPSLKSLHTLEIIDCSKLSSLPKEMNRLTALRELTIQDCPELIRKCKEEDRSKVAHIPTVRLLED